MWKRHLVLIKPPPRRSLQEKAKFAVDSCISLFLFFCGFQGQLAPVASRFCPESKEADWWTWRDARVRFGNWKCVRSSCFPQPHEYTEWKKKHIQTKCSQKGEVGNASSILEDLKGGNVDKKATQRHLILFTVGNLFQKTCETSAKEMRDKLLLHYQGLKWRDPVLWVAEELLIDCEIGNVLDGLRRNLSAGLTGNREDEAGHFTRIEQATDELWGHLCS